MTNSRYTQYLLDTNVLRSLLSEADANHAAVVSNSDRVYKNCIWVPVIVAVESLKGASTSVKDSDSARDAALKYDLFLRHFRSLCGFQVLPYQAEYEQQLRTVPKPSGGKPVGERDKRIACIALAHGCKIVTRNTRDFLALGMPPERLVDWTIAPDFSLNA